MAKLFNEEMINYVRSISQKCNFDPNEFEPGETYIAQQPARKGHVNAMKTDPTSEGHRKTTTPVGEGEPCSEDEDVDWEAKGAGDAKTDLEFHEFLANIGITSPQYCAKCNSCNKLGPPIRRILGPFPDEPIMAALDKIFALFGITFYEETEEMAELDEEFDASDDETEGLNLDPNLFDFDCADD